MVEASARVKPVAGSVAEPVNAGAMAEDKTREERLAEQLRANLRRRKAQAREREAPPPEPPQD